MLFQYFVKTDFMLLIYVIICSDDNAVVPLLFKGSMLCKISFIFIFY